MALAGNGGAPAAAPPSISTIECSDNCAGKRARAGATVHVDGSNLRGVRTIVFLGGAGSKDDVDAGAQRVHRDSLTVQVPAGASSGPLQAQAASVSSAPSRRVLRVADSPPPPPPLSDAEGVRATVHNKRVFVSGRRHARMTYELTTNAPRSVRVTLARTSSGKTVRRWKAREIQPDVPQTVRWNGKAHHRALRSGRYEFRIEVRPTSAATRAGGGGTKLAVQEATVGSVRLLGAIFPIRGRHDYGTAANRFGAPRSGHTHQGQDVLAACGTKLVVAQAGRVRFNAFQSAAGNYVVIHSTISGLDEVYMHLRSPSPLKRGQHVHTGQVLGIVGETGDATACHLHFELWTKPGWYQGGHPIDPLRRLKSWDRRS